MENTVPIKEGIFKQGPDGLTLLGCKCGACGKVSFPKLQRCPHCLNEELGELPLSQRGLLYSYTIVHMPTASLKPPYAVGWLETTEGVRVFAPLEMVDGKPFQVGMEMEVRVFPLWMDADKEVIGYRFTPI